MPSIPLLSIQPLLHSLMTIVQIHFIFKHSEASGFLWRDPTLWLTFSSIPKGNLSLPCYVQSSRLHNHAKFPVIQPRVPVIFPLLIFHCLTWSCITKKQWDYSLALLIVAPLYQSVHLNVMWLRPHQLPRFDHVLSLSWIRYFTSYLQHVPKRFKILFLQKPWKKIWVSTAATGKKKK